MSQAKTTTDHQKIRQWVEARKGRPATVAGTPAEGEEAGLLRIDFPGDGPDENLDEIDWDAFFAKFDEAGLEFLYQEQIDGQTSRFCKFVRQAK